MRHHVRAAAAAAAIILAVPASARNADLTFLGQQTFETGTQVLGTTLGGISGIDYSASLDRYIANSDDPTNARFYTLDLAITPTSFDGVSFTGVTTFKTPAGGNYATGTIDAESIRFAPDGTIAYTSEGYASNGVDPFIRTADLATGALIGNYTVPGYYLSATNTGIRNNLAFESMTFTVGGGPLVVATENALKQDGPAATATDRSPSRIMTFDTTTGMSNGEYVYLTSTLEVPEGGFFGANGLVEMLSLGGTRYLALERSLTAGGPNSGWGARLYEIDLAGATNVSGVPSLAGVDYTPVSKTLLFDLGSLGIPLDNLEAMTFGETLSDGSRSLIVASDNNFAGTQFTQFLAFRVAAVPEPTTWAMMIGGFGVVGGAMRRRQATLRTAAA